MSLLLLEETATNLPVQDPSLKTAVVSAVRAVSSAKCPGLKSPMKGAGSLAKTRRQLSQVNRAELEDGFLRLYDENLLLKQFARKQEERIKRMGTKLSRLGHGRTQVDGRPGSWLQSSGRNLELEEDLEDTQERVRELEKRNDVLRNRLLFYKQQLQLQGCGRHCPYGHVPARVNTGLRRPNTTSGRVPERLRKGMRPTHTAPPRCSNHALEGSQTETERLIRTHSLVLAELEFDPESLSSGRDRDTDPESSSRTQQRHLEVQERRAAIRDNVELIRLQKLLRVKNSELVVTKAQFAGLQDAYETHLQQNQEALRSASEALLAQVEELNAQLKEESQKVATLESQLEMLSPLQGTLKDFQERVEDLEQERDLLKADYDKLLESCINPSQQNHYEMPQKDCGPSLEEQLNSAIVEKQKLQEELEEERARNEKLKHEVSLLLLERSPEGNPLCEAAAILESQSKEKEPHSIVADQPFCPGVPEKEPAAGEASPTQQNLRQRLHKTEAAHAETVLELEKTRDMLILQHRINRDYQAELEGLLLQTAREKQAQTDKEEQMARLLDLRGARIHQLEEQLKDVAYGTKRLPLLLSDGDAPVEADMAPQLRRGENLFELHISGATLSAEALRLLRDPDPVTFCTYSFYDFETHCTPVVRGARPRYDFTSQYVVQVEPLFLQYLQGATSRLDLHLASALDHAILASCWLRFGGALGSGEQVHATATLQGSNGEDYGILEYWVRLRLPIERSLRLQQQRTKSLGYLSAGVPPVMVAQKKWQQEEERALGPDWNELRIKMEGCSSLQSRWLGSQPSPYVMYKFFTFPDHDTVVIPSSNSPHFGDLQTFPLRVTPELHYYLLLKSLWVYVFDDEDEEPGSYLGKAQVLLLPLAHGHSITGDFALTDPAGKPNGSIRLSLEWKHLYVPPEDVLGQVSADWEPEQKSLEQLIKEEKALLQSQVPRDRRAGSLPPDQQRKKLRLCLPESERPIWKHPRAKPERRDWSQPRPTRGSSAVEHKRRLKKKDVDRATQEVALEEVREEEKMPSAEEEAMPVRHQESDAESSISAGAAVIQDIVPASQEPDSTSTSKTTESDEVVVGSSGLQDLLVSPSDKIRVEIISLSLHPESHAMSDDNIQQLYVEFHFPGVPLAETETPFSLRKPQGNQEIYFHFNKVIRLDPDPESLQRQVLFSMLDAEEPQCNWLPFVVVSEPLPGSGGECEDVGFAHVNLREILLTGRDILEQDLYVTSSFDPDTPAGKLKVSVEAAAALRSIYWSSKRKGSEEG